LNFSKTSFEALWLLADMVTLLEEIRNRSAEGGECLLRPSLRHT